jgi:hypothetical protein
LNSFQYNDHCWVQELVLTWKEVEYFD